MGRRVLGVAAVAGLTVLLLAGGYRLGKDAALPGLDAEEVSLAEVYRLVELDRVVEVRGYPGRADLVTVDQRRVWTRLPVQSQSFFNFLNQHSIPFRAEYKMTARSRVSLWIGMVTAPLLLMAAAAGVFGWWKRGRKRDTRALSSSYA